MLYSYHRQSSTKPNIVLSLHGAICNPIADDDNPYISNGRSHHWAQFAFQIVSTISRLTRIIYLDTAEQRDRWVEAIRIASRDFKLPEHYQISSVVHPCLPNVFECKGAYTGQHYMMKYIDKIMVKDSDLLTLRIESGVLRFVDDHNIAKSAALYEDNDRIYILRPYIPNWVRLDEIINARGIMSLNTVALIMRQVISGLRFLHSQGMILGAFGPANIVLCLESLRKHRIQMVDIGLRKFFVSALDDETRSFIAPEVEEGGRIGPKCDMWSVGAILYRLLTPESTLADVNAAKNGELDLSRTRAPKEVTYLLRRLLNRNASKRYCSSDLLKAKFIQDAVESPLQLRFPKHPYTPEYLSRSVYHMERGEFQPDIETKRSRLRLERGGERVENVKLSGTASL